MSNSDVTLEKKRTAPVPRKRGPYKKAKLDGNGNNHSYNYEVWDPTHSDIGEQGDNACVECDEGGTLYICDSCRLVYHEECLKRFYSGLYQDLHSDHDQWICYCCKVRAQQGTERYYRWLLERFHDQINSPIAALPYFLKEIMRQTSTIASVNISMADLRLVVDIPNDRRYPRYHYQSIFKHLGLMNCYPTVASRNTWSFTPRFDLELFISVFSARIGRRTLAALDKDALSAGYKYTQPPRPPSAILQALVAPLAAVLGRSGKKPVVDSEAINFSPMDGPTATYPGILSGLAPFAEELERLLPRLDMELRLRGDGDKSLQSVLDIAILWKTLKQDLSALHAALTAFLTNFSPSSQNNNHGNEHSSPSPTKESISHALYSALVTPHKTPQFWANGSLYKGANNAEMTSFRAQEEELMQSLAKVRSKIRDLGEQSFKRKDALLPLCSSSSSSSSTSASSASASSTQPNSNSTNSPPSSSSTPNSSSSSSSSSSVSSPSTSPPASSSSSTQELDLPSSVEDETTLPFFALHRMIDEALKILDRDVTTRLLAALEFIQQEIVKQGWATALASLKRDLAYRNAADRSENSTKMRDFNAVVRRAAQRQIDEIEVARTSAISKITRLRDLLPVDQRAHLTPVINVILDLCDAATPPSCTRATRVLYHDKCFAHVTRESDFECADRLKVAVEVMTKLSEELGGERLVVMANREIPDDIENFIIMAHPPSYVNEVLRMIPAKANSPPVNLAQTQTASYDTCVSHESFVAAKHAAGIVCTAIDMVINEPRCANAFCAVRPPGHHAGPTGCALGAGTQGFCILNNVAIGTLYALGRYGASGTVDSPLRVAIVDFDLHRGNGTEQMVSERCNEDRVLFISMHAENTARGEPFYPYPLLPPLPTPPKGVLNIPLDPGTTSSQFRQIVNNKVIPALQSFGPTLLLISAGFDLHKDDPLNAGLILVDETDIGWLTNRVTAVCPRAVAVLEGGYGISGSPVLTTPFGKSLNSTLRALVESAEEAFIQI